MASEDGRHVIAFNGEIYNFVELRDSFMREGFQPRTRSDTEVLLEAWKRWGTDICQHLDGMFAFAIADREDGSLFLARDRFGEKPLFIQESNDGVTFSSEFGAFQCLDDYDPEMDFHALGSFLCLNYVPGQRSLVRNVKKMTPGTWRLYRPSGLEEGQFWSTQSRINTEISFDEAKRHARHLIDDGVRLALRSDVPVTLFLSGGIDSTIVAESATRQADIKKAWCLDMAQQGFSELPMAMQVGRELGLDVEPVSFSADAMNDFFDIAKHQDDPMADSSALAVWTLARRVGQDYKVALGGDGGDELFGGYLTYRATRMQGVLRRFMPKPIRNLLARSGDWLPVTPGKVTKSYKMWRFLRAFDLDPSEAHYTWNGTWLPKEAAALVSDQIAAEKAETALARLAGHHNLNKLPGILDLQRVDIAEYLPHDILTKTDRCTMAWGLEARSPLLYRPLADFALTLPDKYKFKFFGAQKRLLRELVCDRFGRSISHASKQGFSIPVHHWLRVDAREVTENVLHRERLKNLWFLDVDEVIRVKDKHMRAEAQYGFELWGLMVLTLWFENRFLMREFRKPQSTLKKLELS